MEKQATHSEREKFVADLVKTFPKANARHAQRLMRLAGTYNSLMADANQQEIVSFDSRGKLCRIRSKVLAICQQIDAGAGMFGQLHVLRDPVEHPVLIKVPGI